MPGGFESAIFKKLGSKIFNKLTKKVAKTASRAAERSPLFRKYVCVQVALVYMWSERMVDRLARGGPPKDVPPYVEKKAVRLGAHLIGEFIIFGTAATFITLEFLRQGRKRRLKQQEEILGKQALRQQARDAQYNRDRRTSELKDLRNQIKTIEKRLLPPSLQNKLSDTDGEPDAVTGIRIEDEYLDSGVAVRAQEGADDEMLERAAAKAARKLARARGEDTEVANRKAAEAALQESMELKEAKKIEKKEDEHDMQIIHPSSAASTKASVAGAAVEAPKKREEWRAIEHDKKKAEAAAEKIIKEQKEHEKKPKESSKEPKVEGMSDKEAEDAEKEAAEEAAKVALDQVDPNSKDWKVAKNHSKKLAPAGDRAQVNAEVGTDSAKSLDTEKHGQSKNVTRRGSSLLPWPTSLGRWKSGFVWTAFYYFIVDAFRSDHNPPGLALKPCPVPAPTSSPGPAYDSASDPASNPFPDPSTHTNTFTGIASQGSKESLF